LAAVKLTMAKPFKPLTNLFFYVSPIVNHFLTRAIATTELSYLGSAEKFGTFVIPVAAPRAVIGIFGLQWVILARKSCQGLLKT